MMRLVNDAPGPLRLTKCRLWDIIGQKYCCGWDPIATHGGAQIARFSGQAPVLDFVDLGHRDKRW